MVDGRENCLLEVEREDKALSMLLLKTNNLVNWKRICSILIMELVNRCGKWSNKKIDLIEERGIFVFRSKHIKKRVYKKENFIYEKLK